MAVSMEEIAADPVPGADGPIGPLPAAALGVKPETDEYAAIVRNVQGQVEGFLAALGNYGPLTKLAAIRLFSAEAVLTRAQTGRMRDPSGASVSLSSGDLDHWIQMRDSARTELEKLVPKLRGKTSSGITFAQVTIQDTDTGTV